MDSRRCKASLAEQDADASCAALLAGAGLRCHELLALAVTADE